VVNWDAKQFNMSLRIEFLRTSTFISTLPTILKMTRTAAHPNIVPMLDCYHFWSGLMNFKQEAIMTGREDPGAQQSCYECELLSVLGPRLHLSPPHITATSLQ